MNYVFKICVALCFVAQTGMAQVVLGEACGPEKDAKVDVQIDKALKAINANNTKMAAIYINNAFKMQDKNAHAFYLAGEVAIREKNLLKTEANWVQLLKLCPDYKSDLYFFLGVVLMENGKKEQSAVYLEKFLERPDRERGYDKDAKAALREVKTQENLLSNPVPFNPKPVMAISTGADEYLAIISPDEELCFFTRRSQKRDQFSGPANTLRTVEEFTLATKTGGNYSSGNPLPPPFNQSFNEGGATITANNKELYFTVCTIDEKGYQNCDIYFSLNESGSWTDIKPLSETINKPDSWESQPSVSANGALLFFTSNRKEGRGGLDLYVCKRQPDGSWSAPENLGEKVNTSKNEKSPFLHSDSETLYFASDGQQGLGGYDIFFSKFNSAEKTWGDVKNIGYPINTTADEIGLFVSLNGHKAYFNSNKLKGKGGWDLYEFDLYEAARPEKVALVKGVLKDENNNVVRDAELEVKNLKTKEITKVAVDKNTGEFATVVKMKDQEDMILKVNKKGTAFTSKFIAADEDENASGVVQAELSVSPITVGKEYRLNDVNFATNSFELSENAKQIIDEFILFLRDNPTVKVDIQGHTDNAGSPEANLTLSQNRAQVVYNYLSANGISASRLTHHGYGQTKPLAANTSEAGMAQNRRTVFVVTAK